MRDALKKLLRLHSDIDIAASVNTEQDPALAAGLKPDLALIDLYPSPAKTLEIVKFIMANTPLPVVIMTNDPDSTILVSGILKAGATAVVKTPSISDCNENKGSALSLVAAIRAMSEVKVVTRKHKGWSSWKIRPTLNTFRKPLIAIGASTGGPPVLQVLLSGIPGDLPAAIMIVQHISHGFVNGLKDWLQRYTDMAVEIAVHGSDILVGHIYIAPDGYHMGIGQSGKIVLDDSPPENSVKPSVSHLFRSVGKFNGSFSIGILLTGMGRDGAGELLVIQQAGGITIVQDKGSSVVYGMPGAALEMGAAMYVMEPAGMAKSLPGFVDMIMNKLNSSK